MGHITSATVNKFSLANLMDGLSWRLLADLRLHAVKNENHVYKANQKKMVKSEMHLIIDRNID